MSRRAIFFYGLFMDRELLEGQGLTPQSLGRAVLHHYRIHIGARATLIASDGDRCFGVVMTLTEAEAESLYAEPSVREYAPEPVHVDLLDSGGPVAADCYNLPSDLAQQGTNPAYAAKLSTLLERLGFDAAYVREVADFGR
ncbi:MAG: gamma-glutamylcyclotransferase family protein [Gemmatimonadota bacterium]